ncbi:hypothetical protein LZG04_23985 [Saccharothrix sp. S26]|uniref:hypothetical protein n=1 Tax=Saccharothrix sp. S26 TaxID=2907215 RepID=UPI001F1C372E|nr:hypothetical protein [Saccharothrix sp. S26]MCE6997834.1 hypothetical protein [Saccharothrix sp. S26]
MARAVVVAIALALIAVLVPSPSGPVGVLRTAPIGHTVATSEEEPAREGRTGAEPRSWTARPAPARPAADSSRVVPVLRRVDASTGTDPPVGRGRPDHLRSWSTPSALQVFRN